MFEIINNTFEDLQPRLHALKLTIVNHEIAHSSLNGNEIKKWCDIHIKINDYKKRSNVLLYDINKAMLEVHYTFAQRSLVYEATM